MCNNVSEIIHCTLFHLQAFGFITFFIMGAELAYNIYLLRRDHPPTENTVLLFVGVERKPPGNAPVYDQDNTTSDSPEESKY